MDVTNQKSVNDTNEKLKNSNLAVNVLVNNAAVDPKIGNSASIDSSSRLENFSLERWNKEIAVGLTGSFICSKIFGTEMYKMGIGGCILNIASDLSIIAPDQRLYKSSNTENESQPVKPITYSVIKSGIIGLTKYLSTYWLGSKIRCNSLSPGGVYNGQSDEFLKNFRINPNGKNG